LLEECFRVAQVLTVPEAPDVRDMRLEREFVRVSPYKDGKTGALKTQAHPSCTAEQIDRRWAALRA
jgi:hypothetical protein